MTNVQATFITAIELIGSDKVRKLLKGLGYNADPSADLCMKVLEEKGKEFSVPFGKMLKHALKRPASKQKIEKIASLKKASGKTDTSMTAKEKSDVALTWLDKIGDLLINGTGKAGDLANATNGTNATLALVEYERQQRLAEEAKQQNTLYWILGGIGGLLLVTIFVIALSKRS